MIRHDRPKERVNTDNLKPDLGGIPGEVESDYKDPVIGEIRNGRKIVSINKKTQQKLVALFMLKLRGIIIEGENLISNITSELIIINPIITLNKLKEITNDNTLGNYDQFIKNYYSATVDDLMDEVFGEKVTCLNEVPYSMVSSQQRANVVTYDFLN